MTAAHECQFPEVEIGDDVPGGVLTAGMLVLAPCSCGQNPLDEISWYNSQIGEFSAALANARPATPLYHWAPTARRNQINHYGLRPFMRSTTSAADAEYRAPVICFADSPSWAWALSGGMRWTLTGEWDLWQTDLDRLTDPLVLPSDDRPSGIHEVRTEHRVYKRDLWLAATRTKTIPTPRRARREATR